MKLARENYRLCLVTDRGLAHGRPLGDIVAAAVRGGATMVQLREKDASTREFLREALALKALLASLAIPLIINDRVDIALAVDAEGVHVGQSDMPVDAVRRLIGPNKLIGLSITDKSQMLQPDAATADYLGIGPVYAQTTKAHASAALGVEGFARLRRMTGLPVLAIGGLKPENSAAVLMAGADGLAVVSAIIGADDPGIAAADFIRLKR